VPLAGGLNASSEAPLQVMSAITQVGFVGLGQMPERCTRLLRAEEKLGYK